MPEENELTLSLQSIELGHGAGGPWAWGNWIIWNYGHSYSDEDIEAAFRVSLELGVNFVDTAEVYGIGHSERLLGEIIKKTGQPTLVTTKFFPLPWRFTKKAVVRALKGSLERLGLERVDLYLIHWPSPIVPIETYVEGLAETHQAGLTRNVGISNYNKNQMQRAYTVLSKYSIPLAANQVEYNLLNRVVEKNGLLARCQELGVRLVAYSPLAMGLLTGKYTPETPPRGVRAGRYLTMIKGIQPLIELMTKIGQDLGGKSPTQIALNWLICKGSLPIHGAKNVRQAKMNAGAKGWRLTDEQIKMLDEASDAFTKV
jgi:aryl-alcohol dehydrogenase-like predicted oxidoreductase